jgi:thioredoxin 1
MLTISGSSFGSNDILINITDSNPLIEFPETPVVVNDSTLVASLSQYSPFVLECWEIGCRPCQRIDPAINEMANDLKGKVVFGKLNIDQNIKTMVKYRVFNYPTLLIFKNGRLVYRHIGNYPKATLEKMILEKLDLK